MRGDAIHCLRTALRIHSVHSGNARTDGESAADKDNASKSGSAFGIRMGLSRIGKRKGPVYEHFKAPIGRLLQHPGNRLMNLRFLKLRAHEHAQQ